MDTTTQIDSTKIEVDTSAIAIIPFDSTGSFIFSNSKAADLTPNDLLNIERLLIEQINLYNNDQEKLFMKESHKYGAVHLSKSDFIIEIKNYHRQYIAATNSRGEKEVWINCFCNSFTGDWRKGVIIVEDGGNCYFNLFINLTTGKCYGFLVNGVA